MANLVRIPVKPEIWHWALNEAKVDENKLINRFPKAEEWLNQELHPTFNQLETVAKFLHIPFGYMFLDSPPKESVIEVEFRSISNKMPQVSKELQDTILDMDQKRNWMSQYREDIGWSKLEVIQSFNEQKTGDTIVDAELAKTLLDLPEDWQGLVKDLDQAFGFLREKLERIGILVMRNGVVGSNNHRSLDIEEFRAFVLYDDLAPLIFINNNDSKAGKVFSLVHEYLHILFQREDIFVDPYVENTSTERQINALTAEFLMPQEKILSLWCSNLNVFDQIENLSRLFKVSKMALAIKLYNLNLVDREIVENVKEESIRNFKVKAKGSGGDYYVTFQSRISTVFAETVIRSAESGEIGYTEAFRLLGVKGKTYDNIKANLMPYG